MIAGNYARDICDGIGFDTLLAMTASSLKAMTEQMGGSKRHRLFEESPDDKVNSLLFLEIEIFINNKKVNWLGERLLIRHWMCR